MREESKLVKHIVIVGGGTAGWLVAARLGAEFDLRRDDFRVTLIESDETGPIGVGEGTWPSMRTTLSKIGLSETDFIRECGASFKQGSKFTNWTHGKGESYYHPFTLPEGYAQWNAWERWSKGAEDKPFAQVVSPQPEICEAHLAPKQIGMPSYAYALNYGYHLDAGRFATMLKRHAIERLGVKHIVDHLVRVESCDNGDIAAVVGRTVGAVSGDLFVDCSGFAALLMGQHFGIDKTDVSTYLFNDRALAVQIPYAEEDAPIESVTLGTAHEAGWTWDIGLQHRRGVGRVYSSAHQTDDEALAGLESYLRASAPHVDFASLNPRQIRFESGYRKEFWHRNCVAIGLSAGFVEPLEASALVLVELGANFLCEQMPASRAAMKGVSARFNEQFTYRWQEIIRFLKLHYVLSERTDTAYWRHHKDRETIPQSLLDDLDLWRHRSPWHYDEGRTDQLFPSASYQYVLYGMGFSTYGNTPARRRESSAQAALTELQRRQVQQRDKYMGHLPSNRALLNQLKQHSFNDAQRV